MVHLYSHGGSENHGCEAIVRTTVKMIGQPAVLWSMKPEQDLVYGVDQICQIREDWCKPIKYRSFSWFLSSLQTKLTGKLHWMLYFQKREMLQQIRKSDVLLSIGGDNYCYSGTDILASVHHNLRRRCAKTVLWGCSVEPEQKEE